MNSRQLKRGENIIGLTQTEIMLVLTIVVLVLLLASDIDLKASQKQVVLLENLASESQENVEEILEQVEFNEEIKEVMVNNGMVSDYRGQSRLTEQDMRMLKGVIEKSRTKDEQLSQLQNALQEKQKIIDKMREQSAALKNERRDAAGKGSKYGYTPCWPRTGQGPKKRYHTYDVTYSNGLFSIKQNFDWSKPEVPKLDEKLDRKLSAVLHSYPRKAVSKQDFAEFGKRVENVLSGMRGNDRDGWYERGCSLVVTLNPEASGSIAEFIRESVGMYPITR